MKILRKISFVIFLFALLFLFSHFFANSYDDKTTHPALTDEIVDFYNLSFENKLTPEEKELIVQGSIDEDTPPRWINHFYDPIYNEGWKAENLGDVAPSTLRLLSKIFFNINTEIVSSKDWVHNEFLQTRYQEYGGNNTWENAIRKYAQGDKKEAYYILGHILHLLEDATVPDHTKNDTHAHEGSIISKDGGSPYEDYSSYYNRQNLNIAKGFKDANNQSVLLGSIDDYFDSSANYSNKYFFSEDTINSNQYQNPQVIKVVGSYLYGKDKDETEFPLAKEYAIWSEDDKTYKKILTLWDKTNSNIILSSYFSRLSRQAVLNGAGAIKLFHDEAEKVKRGEIILPPEPQIAWWQKMRSPAYGAVAIYSGITNTLSGIASYFTNTFSGIFTPPSPEMLVAQLSGVNSGANVSNQAPPPAQIPSAPINQSQSASTSPIIIPATATREPGERSSRRMTTNQPTVAPPVLQVNNILPVQIPRSDLEIQSPSQVVATTTVDIVNTATSTAATTTPVTLSYQGGGWSSGVSVEDLAKQQAQAENLAEAPTSSAEDAIISHENSTSTDAFIDDSNATSTPSIEATTTEPIIIATTTTQTLPDILPDILPGYFNASVVINEIAWMGTKVQANDEWIELYNKTSQPIDLTGWTLENSNQSLKINLKGAIQPRSYYLLERTASTTTDQEEDMVYTGTLPNSGQVANLYLRNASSSIIDHIHQWYAGNNNPKNTMERVSPYIRGEAPSNWGTYASSTSTPLFAKDADGNDIFGTPGAKNSVSTYTPVIDHISQNTIWYKSLNPYRIQYNIRVEQNAVLTIQPGVVVEFTRGAPYGGGLDILGVLLAEGAQDDQIIFTSGSQTPKPGDWLNIIFSNPSQISTLKHVQVKYGGQGINRNPNGWYPTYEGAVSIINSSPEISHSIFDQNQVAAIYIAGNSNPKITGNIIKNTDSYTYQNGPLKSFGIQLADSAAAAEISSNTIESNLIGIKSASASATPLIIKENTFANNGMNGEFKTITFLNIDNSGNQDSNKQSGFYLDADFHSDYANVIKKDIMPYIVSDIIIRASSTVIIEPGTVFKNSGGYYGISKWLVQGALKAKGTQEQPIIFTSTGDGVDGYNQGGQPNAGDWNRLHFTGDNASQSEIDYAVFRYGDRKYSACPWAVLGGPCWAYDGVVLIENSSPTITNSIFEFNNQPDIKIKGVSLPTLGNNTIGEIVRE